MASSASASGSVTPPYPSAARIADSLVILNILSLKCLEEFNSDKSKCQEHFDIYKECKEKERQALDLNVTGIGLSSHETSFDLHSPSGNSST